MALGVHGLALYKLSNLLSRPILWELALVNKNRAPFVAGLGSGGAAGSSLILGPLPWSMHIGYNFKNYTGGDPKHDAWVLM